MDYKDNIVLYVASSKHDEQMKLFTEDFRRRFCSPSLALFYIFISSTSSGKRQLYLCQSVLELYQSNPDLASFSVFSVTILTGKVKNILIRSI